MRHFQDKMTWAFSICFVFLASAGALKPIHLEERKGRPHAFVAADGREILFHGSAAVVKGPPWYPDHSHFSEDISMAKQDFEWMQKLGLNFLRLGLMWPGLEPIRGQYNETYLEQIDKIVTMAGEHGVYVMLDMHQDGFSEYFCGEGFPNWAVKRTEDRWYDPFSKPFPAPYDNFENESCFYIEEKHQGAKFPTHQACDHHKHGVGWGEGTFESSQAYQAFWSNWNGIGDAFASMWAKVAARFKNRAEVVGYNLINEPFAGDFWHNPLLMIPWPSPTNADRVNMQATYDKVNAAVRAVDEDVLLFIAGVTWGDLGSGFSAAPGGPAYSNRTVITYHFYQPPQFGAEEQVRSHVLEARRLGTAAMMTETEALYSTAYHKNYNIANACDAHLQGWADWEWKSFFRAAPNQNQSVSQYYAWGAPKTGHGMDWDGDTPPEYYFKDLARTYAPSVVGTIVKMHYDAASAAFELQYDVGSIDTDIATEIFVLPSRYPDGVFVLASATVGSIQWTVEGQWVRVYASEGLQVGARVTVKISKKTLQEILV